MNSKPHSFSGVDRHQIDEIKDRIPIEDVIKRYIDLKPVGRNLFGKCPFHSEDTPSFSVNSELKFYKCFGCGESGDVIKFLQKIENYEFYEALSQLAKEAGIKLRPQQNSSNNRKYQRAKEASAMAAKYYQYMLHKHQAGIRARDYVKNRKLQDNILEEFGVGYAPHNRSRNALVKFLKKSKFTPKESVEFGLAQSRRQQIIDRFYDRLMFPIHNNTGEVIGFSGRVINSDDERPKYLNSPETPIFSKRHNLFGLFQAKQAIREKDIVILVEGQTDVLSSHQVGVKNIVAPLGTGISDTQISKLKKYTENIAVAFDNDNAGFTAGIRTTQIGYQNGLNMKAVEIPVGKDADECIRKNEEQWIKAVNNSTPALSFFLEKLSVRNNPQTLQGKKKILEEMIPLLASVKDKVIQKHHIEELASTLRVEEPVIVQEIKHLPKYKLSSDNSPSTQKLNISNKSLKTDKEKITQEKYLLAILLNFPKKIPDVIDQINAQNFKDKSLQKILDQLFVVSKESDDLITSKIYEKLNESEKNLMKSALLYPIWSSTPTDAELDKELSDIIKNIQRQSTLEEIDRLKAEMKRLEMLGRTKKANEILNQINTKLQRLST